MKIARRYLTKTLAFLVLVIGSITILQASVAIIDTTADLLVLHEDAMFYNEQVRKTDEMTATYLRTTDAERHRIYNSDDVVVKVFSNQNAALKIAILLLALLSFVLIPYMWGELIYREIRRARWYAEHGKFRKMINQKKGGDTH